MQSSATFRATCHAYEAPSGDGLLQPCETVESRADTKTLNEGVPQAGDQGTRGAWAYTQPRSSDSLALSK